MTAIASRKSDPKLAGEYCTEIPCRQYARYGVTRDLGDGVLADPEGFCGQHLGEALRAVWAKHNTAAVVQEVPGAWRPAKDSVRRA